MSDPDRKSAARAVLGGGSQGARRAKQQRPRIQAWLPDDETDERIRNAFAARGAARGYSSLGDVIAKAVVAEVARWETEDNDGDPFPAPAVEAITVTTGRPLRVGPRHPQ